MSTSFAPSVPETHSARRRARQRRKSRGFTLVELSVALVGGLIVALAVVGLSKEATTTFHEEVRVASAEMSLRTAVDRLRTDLSRAGYMSTGNIWGDPALVSNFAPGGSTAVAVRSLSSVRLFDQGSTMKTNLGASTAMNGTDDSSIAYSAMNGLAPDAIDITGNLNEVDSYSVQTIEDSSCGSGGKRLILSMRNPPAYRLAANGGQTALQRAFLPVSGQNAVARLQDSQGRVQYLPVCGVGYVSYGAGAGVSTPYVDLAEAPVTATGKGNVGGEAGFFSGSIVNPVITVRYKIAPTQIPYVAELGGGDGGASAVNKFDLYRVYVSAANVEVGTPELIAEYMVDLRFSFTVDNTAASGPPQTTTRTHKTFAFGDTQNQDWAAGPIAVSAATPPAGPQRIRSIRFRMASRGAIADRAKLISPPTSFTPATGYLYRYCTDDSSPCNSYARVRTVIGEVALQNQARSFYP